MSSPKRFIYSLLFIVATASLHAVDYSTLNIDCGEENTAPDDSYAAAGNAGYWNLLSHLNSTPQGDFYDNQNQRPAWLQNVTVRADEAMSSVTPNTQPFSNTHAALLGDYLVSGRSNFSIYIEGLPVGSYTLILYFVGRQDHPSSSSASIGEGAIKDVTGIWDGTFEEGVTHEVFSSAVGADGTLSINLSTHGDAFISGMQLISSTPATTTPPISDYLDQANWEWTVAGKGWTWPTPANDALGGVGIEGTLSSHQTSSLSTVIPGPTHLRFYWGGNLPYDAEVNLIINGQNYTKVRSSKFSTAKELEGYFQVFLPEASNQVLWQIRNLVPSETQNFSFFLDTTETVGGTTNQAPSIVKTHPAFISGINQPEEWLEAEDADGDTPVFQVSSDYPEEAFTNFRLPPGIHVEDSWQGRAILSANHVYINDIGLYPLFVSAKDGGSEVNRELSLEIKNPFASGIIQKTEALLTTELFGLSASGLDLIHILDDTAWLQSEDFSQLTEYTRSGAGQPWGLASTIEISTAEESYQLQETVAIDHDQIAVIAKTENDGERFALVYLRDNSSSWQIEAAIPIPGTFQDQIPCIDLNGKWLAVTNPDFQNPENESSGRLFIYERSAEAGWQLNAQFSVPNPDGQGAPLQINDAYIALGACLEFSNDTFSYVGVVHTFAHDEADGWETMGKLYSDSLGSFNPGFGHYLKFLDNQLIIAHPYDSTNGAIFIYDLLPGNLPHLKQVIREETANELGSSLTMNEHSMVVGDKVSSLSADYSGAVYAYSKTESGNWILTALLVSEPAEWYGNFGHQVFVTNEEAYVLNGNGQIHKMKLLNFDRWYKQIAGKAIDSRESALANDENQNGVADGIDFLRLSQAASGSILESVDYQMGNQTFRGIQMAPAVTNGLNWRIEFSTDLQTWSHDDIRLLQFSDTQIWGLPEEKAGHHGFFRIKILSP